MKAVVTIEIFDHTSEEDLHKVGTSVEELEQLYRTAFAQIVSAVLQEGCMANTTCRVTDNTKEDGNATQQ